MRVLMLSWEYPPKIVGGIARHVEELAWGLAERGDEVHVVTCEFPGAPTEETYNGVHIYRVTPYEPTDNFVHWVHQLNHAMRDRAALLLESWLIDKPDVKDWEEDSGIILHAHDWLAYFSGVELKHRFKLPLVGTIHATEYGRNNGIRTDMQRYINEVERSLTHESWRVIVCTDYMKREVEFALNTPWDKMDIIPNGVNAEKFQFDFPDSERKSFRSQFATPDEKIIFFVGRMVREKGAHLLIEALPGVLASGINTKLVIAGGGKRDHLTALAHERGVESRVFLTGFIPDDDLLRLYRVADTACFPSLYEPFGIVALEGMAAGVPVVVSDAGGLPEVVEHDVSGVVTYTGNAESLAWGLCRVLGNADHAAWLVRNATERLNALFRWSRIADMTHDVYARVWSEFRSGSW